MHDELAKLPTIRFDLVTITDRSTSLKTRFRAGSQQILRVDDEITSDIDAAATEQFTNHAMPAIQDADLVVLSDYAKVHCRYRCLKPSLPMPRPKAK